MTHLTTGTANHPNSSGLLLVAPTQPDSYTDMFVTAPLGLYRLAAWVESRTAVPVTVYDPVMDGMPVAGTFCGYSHIGFSPVSNTLATDITLMRMARAENPSCSLIIGGIEATLNYQIILEKADVEWVVLGEGERALEAILSGIPAGQIGGVIHRTFKQHTTADELMQYYDALDFGKMRFEEYWARTESLYDVPDPLVTRTVRISGCTHCNRNCAFCAASQWHKQAVGKPVKPSMLTADQLWSVAQKIRRQVPTTTTIYFCEDDFMLDRQRALDFFALAEGSQLSYIVQSRLSNIDKELIEAAGRAGVRSISMGIENASQEVLKAFNKPQNLDKVPQVIRWCKDAGVVPYLLIILFAPTATMDDMRLQANTLRGWTDLGATISIQPWVVPYRGTQLYDSEHQFEWEHADLGGFPKREMIKRPVVVLPHDDRVRDLMTAFRDRWPDYRQAYAGNHAPGMVVGELMLRLLEDLLQGGSS